MMSCFPISNLSKPTIFSSKHLSKAKTQISPKHSKTQLVFFGGSKKNTDHLWSILVPRILILIFAEALGLYGLIVGLVGYGSTMARVARVAGMVSRLEG